MIRVLGPLRVDGATGRAPTGRSHGLLSWLALDANRPVRLDALARRLWDDDPPERAARYLADLFRRAGSHLPSWAAIETTPAIARLVVDPSRIDSARFEQLVLAESTDATIRTAQLREALALWRGEPYEAIADHPDALPEIIRLGRLRVEAEELLLAGRLQAGAAADHEVLADLNALSASHPERPSAKLLLAQALNTAGRRLEAMRALDELRRGHPTYDPAARDALETAILRGDPGPAQD